MSTKASKGRVRQVYKFIDSHKRQYPVEVMSKILDVSANGYYEWLKRPLF